MMRSILTASGAVIHIDGDSPRQNSLLAVALSAFGGQVGEAIEVTEEQTA